MKTSNSQNLSLATLSLLAFFAIDTTTNTVITTDFSDERYFLNNSSYLSGSKPNTDNPNNIRS
ncbi:MAG TPA: hypothetical protein VFG24_06500, partial [Nitrosopumilaceae archaeon]|nr:hypothetical protein [Nitrosopumilaceae archaeon]